MGGGILEHFRLRLLDIHDLASCAVERKKDMLPASAPDCISFHVPCDDGIYVASSFFFRDSTPYKTFFDIILHGISGWLWYSIPPRFSAPDLLPCYGEDEKPERSARFFDGCRLLFSAFETGCLFCYVFTQSTRLFPALSDLLCTAGYFVLILLPILMKRGDRKC